MATTEFDLAICGAGPVGLTLALLLHQRGMDASRIALIDAKTLEQATADPRSIALSYGSRQILEAAEAWPVAADTIHQIHVSRRGHFGRTMIDREEYDLPALGYVARYGMLVSVLAATCQRAGLATLRPQHVSTSIESEDAVTLHLSNGKEVTTQLMVQAEGGVFSEQAAKPVRRDYDQTAVISHITASAPIAHRAFERFTDEGPLALLPQDGGYALVWCVRPATATRLQALSDDAFLDELQHTFGSRLGRFTGATTRITYPLGLNACPSASARTVAIGNAAQTLHPVAGQGLNLGLRDAAVLARLVAQDVSANGLQRFVQTRQSDRNTTLTLTDTMARIFSSASDGALSQTALGLSLALLDIFKPAKRILAEHMMFGSRS